MIRRLTNAEMVQAFGDPAAYLHQDGTVDRAWEQMLVFAELPAPLPLSWNRTVLVRRFRCHRLVRQPFEGAFQRTFNDPEAWKSIDDFGGCYLFRTNRRNPRELSRHSWGTAVDLDVADNQQGDKTPEMHPKVIEAFELEGFLWGGRFSGASIDGMHLEFADLSRLAR